MKKEKREKSGGEKSCLLLWLGEKKLEKRERRETEAAAGLRSGVLSVRVPAAGFFSFVGFSFQPTATGRVPSVGPCSSLRRSVAKAPSGRSYRRFFLIRRTGGPVPISSLSTVGS